MRTFRSVQGNDISPFQDNLYSKLPNPHPAETRITELHLITYSCDIYISDDQDDPLR